MAAIIPLRGLIFYIVVAATFTGSYAWRWPWETAEPEIVLEVHPPPIDGIISYKPNQPDSMQHWFDTNNKFLDGKFTVGIQLGGH